VKYGKMQAIKIVATSSNLLLLKLMLGMYDVISLHSDEQVACRRPNAYTCDQ